MDKQVACPVCGNRFVAEFYEPRAHALCLQCGTTFRRIRNRLAVIGNLDPTQITPDISFTDIPNLSLLDVVELVMALEEEGVKIPDEEAEEIKTVKDALRVISRHRGK